MLEEWLRKYGSLAAIITGVVLVTVFLVRLDGNSRTANLELAGMRSEMKDLNQKMGLYLQDREKYERWNRQTNARIKRAFNRLGWEYEPIE